MPNPSETDIALTVIKRLRWLWLGSALVLLVGVGFLLWVGTAKQPFSLIVVLLFAAWSLIWLLLSAWLYRQIAQHLNRTILPVVRDHPLLNEQISQAKAALLAAQDQYSSHTAQLIDSILPLGVQLVSEDDVEHLFHTIVTTAKQLASADACTLYLRTSTQTLRPVTMQTDSLKINLSAFDQQLPIPALALYDNQGQPIVRTITAATVHRGVSHNVIDVYGSDSYDFSGPQAFDMAMNYHSMSLLTVPLKDSTTEVIGVLQLINCIDRAQHTIVPFSPEVQQKVEVLASLVAAALVVNDKQLPDV